MAAVSGQGTTFTLPNYHGELFLVTPNETPFLSAIGGLVGAKKTTATQFEWQTVDRRVSSPGNVGLEGANAPSGTERSRSNITNVVEIHHSAIEVSYSRLAAKGNFAGANIASQPDDLLLDELQVQTQAELESMAVDVEQSFISGTYAKPADNLTGRKTRGILAAITTNVTAVTGPLTKAAIDATLISCFNNGSKLPAATTVFMTGPDQKVKLSNLYSTSTLNQPTFTRNIGGINIDTLVTDFGSFGVMVNRWIPAGVMAIVDLSVCAPVFLEIPGKGLLFTEELARVGAARKFQCYGEIGLEYGAEQFHGKLTGLT